MFLTRPLLLKFVVELQPQHYAAASREKKLTMTLLIVTVVSLLLYLPFVIWSYVLFLSVNLKYCPLCPLQCIRHLHYAVACFYCLQTLL